MVLVPYSHVKGWDVLKAPNYGDMVRIFVYSDSFRSLGPVVMDLGWVAY